MMPLALLLAIFSGTELTTECARARPCDPPSTMTITGAPVPFNAPVRFGGKEGVHWRWIKAGEPPRKCTAFEAENGAGYQRACAAKVGDVLYLTMPFRVKTTATRTLFTKD